MDAGEVQIRVTAQVAQAMASLTELGTLAKKTFQEMTSTAKDAESGYSQLDGIVTRMIERVAVMYALHGGAAFIEDIYKQAKALEDMSNNLDIGIGKLQEWEYATEKSGVKMTALTQAADVLGRKMAKGEDGVASAIDTLGLSWEALWRADPGERFDQVARAVAEVQDKITRTGLEVQLFGTDKIDGLVKHLQGLEQQANDTVKSLALAANAYQQEWDWIKKIGAEWFVAASNYVAYQNLAHSGQMGAAAMVAGQETGYDPKTGETVPMSDLSEKEQLRQRIATIEAQLNSMRAGVNSPPNPFLSQNPMGVGKQPGQLNPLNPSGSKEDLAAITATERELTQAAQAREQAERQADEVIMKNYRQQLDVLQRLSKENASWISTSEKYSTEVAKLQGMGPSVTPDVDRIKNLNELSTKMSELTSKSLAEANSETTRAAISVAGYKEQLKIMQETLDLQLKLATNNDIGEAQAKAKNNARFGLDYNGVPNQIANNPMVVDARKRTELESQTAPQADGSPGINTERSKLLDEQFLESVGSGTKAFDEMVKEMDASNAAYLAARDAANEVANAHRGAAAAADSFINKVTNISTPDALNPRNGDVNDQANKAGGMLAYDDSGNPYTYRPGINAAPKPGSGPGIHLTAGAGSAAGLPQHVAGGPVDEGPAYLHGGEYVVPKGGMLIAQGGGGKGDTYHVNLSGMMTSTDPNGLAMIEKTVKKAIDSVARQNRKYPSA